MNATPSEATVRRLLGRLARRHRPSQRLSSGPHATDTDPNREFARSEQTAGWFFAFLSIFILLYAIVEKMHVR